MVEAHDVLWFRAASHSVRLQKRGLDKMSSLPETRVGPHKYKRTTHTHGCQETFRILGNPQLCCRGLPSSVTMVTVAETKCSSVTAAAHTHTCSSVYICEDSHGHSPPPTLTLTVTTTYLTPNLNLNLDQNRKTRSVLSNRRLKVRTK